MDAVNPTSVMWIDGHDQRPLCDVPWLGTSVVLSDGSVNFCCFSNAVVGNVNKETFERIWNGSKMQQIRRALVQQRLPLECQTPSCPLYRGDKLHYILERMDGPSGVSRTGTNDPHAGVRATLAESSVCIERRDSPAGPVMQATLDVRFSGEWVALDVFAALRFPNGSVRFLPGLEDYASPCVTDVEMSESSPVLRVTLADDLKLGNGASAPSELCAAIFERDSNPNLLSNCYWSSGALKLTVQPSCGDPIPEL